MPQPGFFLASAVSMQADGTVEADRCSETSLQRPDGAQVLVRVASGVSSDLLDSFFGEGRTALKTVDGTVVAEPATAPAAESGAQIAWLEEGALVLAESGDLNQAALIDDVGPGVIVIDGRQPLPTPRVPGYSSLGTGAPLDWLLAGSGGARVTYASGGSILRTPTLVEESFDRVLGIASYPVVVNRADILREADEIQNVTVLGTTSWLLTSPDGEGSAIVVPLEEGTTMLTGQAISPDELLDAASHLRLLDGAEWAALQDIAGDDPADGGVQVTVEGETGADRTEQLLVFIGPLVVVALLAALLWSFTRSRRERANR